MLNVFRQATAIKQWEIPSLQVIVGSVAELTSSDWKKLGAIFRVGVERWRSSTVTPSGGVAEQAVEEDPYAHATGVERIELEANAKGIDITEEKWLTEPFGTVEKPAVVPSIFAERIVGVPDPEDDCIITWGIIREGEPPRQLVEGGEYFVLKRVPPPDWAQDT